ncbi:MAG: hypothetical protein HY579_04450 [Nitrospinae bacterium]|nr:hypothetical protein [Nitrospinota bacterium]
MVSTVFLMVGMAIPQAIAETKGPATGEIRIVDPGKTERCASDFTVENIDGDAADLKVVLGNKVYIDEMVNPGERLAYSLPGTISVAISRGREDLDYDDVAIIINLGPKAKLQVRCIDLPSNPLKTKDPLRTFR